MNFLRLLILISLTLSLNQTAFSQNDTPSSQPYAKDSKKQWETNQSSIPNKPQANKEYRTPTSKIIKPPAKDIETIPQHPKRKFATTEKPQPSFHAPQSRAELEKEITGLEKKISELMSSDDPEKKAKLEKLRIVLKKKRTILRSME